MRIFGVGYPDVRSARPAGRCTLGHSWSNFSLYQPSKAKTRGNRRSDVSRTQGRALGLQKVLLLSTPTAPQPKLVESFNGLGLSSIPPSALESHTPKPDRGTTTRWRLRPFCQRDLGTCGPRVFVLGSIAVIVIQQ